MTEQFSPVVQCRHCGNRASMPVKAAYSEVRSEEVRQNDGFQFAWEEGPVYQLLKCPACGKINLSTFYWHDARGEDDLDFQILYPVIKGIPEGLPEAVHAAYGAALSVRSIDPNAFAVLLGRVLEIVCIDRNAKEGRLFARLNDLVERGEIPEKLAEVAKGLRELRNVGAHAGYGELTEQEVPILEDLTRAILEYLYTAQLLATRAAERLEQLKRVNG